jgi:hypothetical protein
MLEMPDRHKPSQFVFKENIDIIFEFKVKKSFFSSTDVASK